MSPFAGTVEEPGSETVESEPRKELAADATCHVPPNATMPSPFVWPGALSPAKV